MAGITSVDLARRVGGQLEQASPDLLRAMVQAFAQALMGAGADAICGAPYGQVSEERRHQNGPVHHGRAVHYGASTPKLSGDSGGPAMASGEADRKIEVQLATAAASSRVICMRLR